MSRVRDADAIIGDRYRSILEMANDGIIVIQDDKIVLANLAFCKILGSESNKLVGRSFESILDPVAMHLYHENQERFIWGQTSRPSFRVRLIASKKRTITVEMSTADFIYDGQPAVVVIARNIMEKMELETAIENSEARYRNLFDSSPFAYFTLSQRGTIHQVNNAACRLLRYEEKDLLKRNISTFIVRDETGQDVGSQILSEINQGKSITDLEMRMRCSDGDHTWVSITASLLETQNQSSEVGFTVVDIDRRKRAESREREERGRADLYLEVMTHDMNNVNQSLMFSLELMNETMDLPDRIQNMLRDTNWSIRRSARMIATMRTIINLRENPPERIKIDSVDNLSKAIEIVKQDFPWKQLNIHIDIENGNLYVAGHSYLENVFFHLLHNAATYDEREVVEVDVIVRREPSTRTIRIEILDRGPGVPDGIKDKIFRRTGSPDEQMVGRGLGLTLVGQIIEHLEGEIIVENRIREDHTQGARFILELPEWIEIEELQCGRNTCITFYKSNHCLFCEPTFEVLMGVMEEMGMPTYLVEVINVDDPTSVISEKELPMLPFIKICDSELTGFVSADQVRSAAMNLMIKHCFPET